MPFSKPLTITLLLLAAWLFWRQPLAVPPGLEMDELIEAQIAEQVLQGDWQPFYEAGQGREGLYYYWLALWLRGTGQNVFTLRMASTTMTLLGLSAIFNLLRRLFRTPTALLGLAYASTSFWLIFAARSGLRSTSLPLLAALAALFFWQGLRHKRWFDWLLAGLCLGLTFYAYTAARILPFAFILFLLYLLLFRRDWLKGQVGHVVLMGAATAVTILPLLLYLQANPQLDQFDFMEFNRPLAALQSGDPQPALQTTLQTLGMFTSKGDPLIFDNVPHRPIFNLPNALLFVAGVLIALWRSRRQPTYAFALIWLIASLIPGMLSQPAPNFYRTVAAQVVAFVFPAIAVFSDQYSVISKRRSLMTGYWLLITLLLSSQFISNYRAYFHDWPQVEGIAFFWQTQLAENAVHLNTSPPNQPVTLCTTLIYEQDPWWRPAWQSMRYLSPTELPIRYYDCRSAFVLPQARPFLSLYLDDIPPNEWWNLPPEGTPIATTATVTLAPEAGGAAATLPVQFGDSLRLLGYEYGASGDGRLPAIITAWEVLQTPPPRLALFTHLMSDPQTVIAQQDGLPLTSHSLQPGDRFWVRHDQIWLPPDLPDGGILVAIGLYSQDTARPSAFAVRLPIQPGGDRLFLQKLEIGD
jgi:hypothetical protein